MGDDRMQLFAKKQAAAIKAHSPMLWKRKDGKRGHYEISTVDHSSPSFREVRFDAFISVEEIIEIVRQEAVARDGQPFVTRLEGIKNGLLDGISISGLPGKMDAFIERFRLRLIEGGDAETLESLALASMKSLLAGEIKRLEKVSQASALHEALVGEGRRLTQELAEFEVVLRGPLKQARLQAVHKLLTVDAAAVQMKNAALSAIAAHKAQLNRRSNARELDLFIDELIESSGLGGRKAKSKMQESARKALDKSIGIESIKRNMLEIARAYKEAAASEAQRLVEKEIGRQARVKMISELLDEACKKHPLIERSFLESSIAKKSNTGTPIEGIRNTLEAVVNGWLKVNAREGRFGADKRELQRSKHGRRSAGDRNPGAGADSTNVGKSSAGSSQHPFNSALADKLALVLMKKE